MGAGGDESGLGRWTWARYQGKGGIKLRVVSIYIPNDNKSAGSVWQQQKSALQDLNDDRLPRPAFFEDFALAMQAWMAMGDHVTVGGDVNEHVTHESLTTFFSAFQMSNLIFRRHDS